MVPDFEAQDIEHLLPKSTLELTDEQMKKRHPLEYIYEPMRKMADPFITMTDYSLILFNFPDSLKVTDKYIHDLCMKQDESAIIKDINIFHSMVKKEPKVAYVIIDFEHVASVDSVKRGLYGTWIQDKLLKPKTLKYRSMEDFNSRTVMI